MPTPYKPTSEVETKIIVAKTRIGRTTDCMPTESPVIMTVAGPVSPDLAIFSTGFDPV